VQFPLELILAIFLMKSYAEYWRSTRAGAPGAWSTFGWIAAWGLASWLAARLLARLAERRHRRGSVATGALIQRYRTGTAALRLGNLAAYWAVLHTLRWTVLADRTWGLAGWPVAGSLAALGPFLAATVASWIPHHRVTREISKATWGLGEYLAHEARYSFFILVPWFFFDGLADLERFLPASARDYLEHHDSLQFVLFAAAFAALMIWFPELLRRLWRCRSLPAGPLRERIESLCRRARLGYRDILLWPMGGSRMANAGVMGLVARHRYVLFTDTLIEALTPDECEAVLGHEIGHVRGRHMRFYLVFAVGFLVLASAAVSLLPAGWEPAAPPAAAIDVPPYVAPLLLVVAFVALYWRVLFGYFSRKLEREADVWGAELAASPVPLITALEKIALRAGGTRNVRSWRHHSVAERVRFLSRTGFDRGAREEYHAHVRRLARGYTAVLALVAALTVWHGFRREGGGWPLIVYRAATEANPDNHEAWMRRGRAALREGRFEEAAEAFERASDLMPRHGRDASDGLRALSRARAANGRYDEAVRHGERAQRLHPDPDFEEELDLFRRRARDERLIEMEGSA